jgi:hypothetical protein
MPPHVVSTSFCPEATLRQLQDGFGDGLLKFARAFDAFTHLGHSQKRKKNDRGNDPEG